MSRYKKAEQLVRTLHSELEEEMKLPALSDISEKRLCLLLERIYRFETRCTLKKQKYSEKQCVALRGAIADLLLLLDSFDLKDAIANRNNESDQQNDMGSVA